MIEISLEGRAAFVTGSTRGIGWAIAETLAKAGAMVALNGKTDAAALDAKAADLASRYNVKTLALYGDVADPEATKPFYPQIHKTFGRLDILVNNAGIMQGALVGMIGKDLVDSHLRTNVAAVIHHLQSAARLIGRNPEGGSIVNLSSILGTKGGEGQIAYAATKAAVVGITKSAAKELAPKKIRVNAVAPGYIATDMVASVKQPIIGLGRAGSPQDVANAVLFLVSDLSSYVTGEVLGVDGAMQV